MLLAGSDERRATGGWAREGPGGTAEGEGDLRVTDEGVVFGPGSAEFLDIDEFRDVERELLLSLFPAGTIRLTRLARRHETFSRALGEARDRARLAGLLSHGIDAPAVFEGTLKDPGPERAARFLVYRTHLAVIPGTADPFQVPFGAVSSVRRSDPEWDVVLEGDGLRVVAGRLARKTEAFVRALEAAREEGLSRLSEATGTGIFADGTGVTIEDPAEFDRLLAAFTAPERSDGAARIVAAAGRSNVRIGFVELLDPDGEALAPPSPLPPNVASFLLAPVANGTLLELLSGPSAATYSFAAPLDCVTRDLRELHFRRRPLALTEVEVAGLAGRPYRLAFRRLEPLRRLRAATRARLVHDARWGEALSKLLG